MPIANEKQSNLPFWACFRIKNIPPKCLIILNFSFYRAPNKYNILYTKYYSDPFQGIYKRRRTLFIEDNNFNVNIKILFVRENIKNIKYIYIMFFSLIINSLSYFLMKIIFINFSNGAFIKLFDSLYRLYYLNI